MTLVDAGSPELGAGGGRAWRIALTAVLAAGMVSATFLQSAVGVLSVFMLDDLGISRAQLGLILATFGLVGAASAPFVGRVVDVIGGRRVMIGLFAISAGASVAVAMAPSFVWILPVSAVAGLGLAAGNPATDKLIAVKVGPRHRGGVVGVKQAGPPLGVLLAGAILPSVAAASGWRTALGWSAVLPGLGLLALQRVVPPDPPPARPGRAPLVGSARATMWWLTWIGAAVATGVAGVLAFVPLYAQEELGMSPATAGAMASLIGLLSVAARIVWGWRAGGFDHVTVPLGAIAAVSVGATLAFWCADAVGPWLAWVGASASAVSMMAWHAVGALGLIDHVGKEAVGGASGVVHLGSSVGFGLGPLLFGLLTDAGGYPLAWAFTASLFAAATVATMLWHRSLRPR